MKLCGLAFKFRASSHSDDYTIIATYEDEKKAEKAKQMLQFMLEDMRTNGDDYNVDWDPDEAYVSLDGVNVRFEVYTAGYLNCVEALLRKVAEPVSLECYQNFQGLLISVTVVKGLTPETALLIMDRDEAEAIKWLIDNCGPPNIAEAGDGEHVTFTWRYEGEGIYYDGTLNIGFEFQVDGRENWEVDQYE